MEELESDRGGSESQSASSMACLKGCHVSQEAGALDLI